MFGNRAKKIVMVIGRNKKLAATLGIISIMFVAINVEENNVSNVLQIKFTVFFFMIYAAPLISQLNHFIILLVFIIGLRMVGLLVEYAGTGFGREIGDLIALLASYIIASRIIATVIVAR
jgi:hypothetical protein